MKENVWSSSLKKMKNTRILALMAAFIAMKVVTGLIRIPIAENLRITLTFLITAVEAAVIGPSAGIISAVITDTLSFILFPDGVYFPGYTLSTALGEMIYALFLYQHKITLMRLGLSKILVNYLVNVLLGSLWSALLYSKAYIVYLSASFIKNTVLLPLEIFLLAVIFRLLSPYLVRRHLLIG